MNSFPSTTGGWRVARSSPLAVSVNGAHRRVTRVTGYRVTQCARFTVKPCARSIVSRFAPVIPQLFTVNRIVMVSARFYYVQSNLFNLCPPLFLPPLNSDTDNQFSRARASPVRNRYGASRPWLLYSSDDLGCRTKHRWFMNLPNLYRRFPNRSSFVTRLKGNRRSFPWFRVYKQLGHFFFWRKK